MRDLGFVSRWYLGFELKTGGCKRPQAKMLLVYEVSSKVITICIEWVCDQSINWLLHNLLHRAAETQQGQNRCPRLQFLAFSLDRFLKTRARSGNLNYKLDFMFFMGLGWEIRKGNRVEFPHKSTSAKTASWWKWTLCGEACLTLRFQVMNSNGPVPCSIIAVWSWPR